MTARRLGAEFLGTAFLMVAIVGSGIATAVDGAESAQLFRHAVVVGAALAALIVTFGHVSGGHFNPAVTLVDAVFGGLSPLQTAGYVVAQITGAVVGVLATNAMFAEALVATSSIDRGGLRLAGSEALATFGLLVVIFGVVRSGNTRAVPGAVGAYIAASIFFTASASFANPAVSVSRALTDTYTGIAPGDVAGFVAAQLLGALVAALVIRWLFDPDAVDAERVVVPHDGRVIDRVDAPTPATSESEE